MKYLGNNSLTYFWSKIKAKLALKQDQITSTNKLNYNLLSNTPTIPTQTSQLTNDSGFVMSNDATTIIISNTEPVSSSAGDIWLIYED